MSRRPVREIISGKYPRLEDPECKQSDVPGQLQGPRRSACAAAPEDSDDAVAAYRLDKLNRCHATRRNGPTAKKTAHAVCIAGATLFRGNHRRQEGPLKPDKTGPHFSQKTVWSREHVKSVLDAKRNYPVRGKSKITLLFQSDGWAISEIMIGWTSHPNGLS